MSDNTFTITDEELEEMRKAQRYVRKLVQVSREIAENPEYHTKKEIATSYSAFLDFFDMVNSAGQHMIEGSVEINQLTSE